jgi:hypothetical protein
MATGSRGKHSRDAEVDESSGVARVNRDLGSSLSDRSGALGRTTQAVLPLFSGYRTPTLLSGRRYSAIVSCARSISACSSNPAF